MRSVINEDSTITAEVKEGEGVDIDMSFENPIRFEPFPSEKHDIGNIEYSLKGPRDGYSEFTANTASLYFTLNKTFSDEFDIYVTFPRIIKVLPYILRSPDKVDGITYFETATPNGEIKYKGTVDEAIEEITICKFDGGSYPFGLIDLRDTLLPDGISIESGSLIDSNGKTVFEEFTSFWEESSQSFITMDNENLDKIIFRKEFNLENVIVFSILVDKYWIDNSDNKLIRKIRTIEKSELFDARYVLLKFDSSNSYVELTSLDTKVEVKIPDTKVSVGKDEEGYVTGATTYTATTHEEESSGTSKLYSQTVAFNLRINLSGDPETEVSNQVFADYNNISFTFMFKQGDSEYFIDCSDITVIESSDAFIVLLLKMKTPQEMGTLYDESKGIDSWSCYLLAKTNSEFSYKIGEFTLKVSQQTFPDTPGEAGRKNTNAYIS
jgi:hypothetical protein